MGLVLFKELLHSKLTTITYKFLKLMQVFSVPRNKSKGFVFLLLEKIEKGLLIRVFIF
jgi:hypothetical protein